MRAHAPPHGCYMLHSGGWWLAHLHAGTYFVRLVARRSSLVVQRITRQMADGLVRFDLPPKEEGAEPTTARFLLKPPTPAAAAADDDDDAKDDDEEEEAAAAAWLPSFAAGLSSDIAIAALSPLEGLPPRIGAGLTTPPPRRRRTKQAGSTLFVGSPTQCTL